MATVKTPAPAASSAPKKRKRLTDAARLKRMEQDAKWLQKQLAAGLAKKPAAKKK